MKLISIMFILSVFSLSIALFTNKLELSNSQEFDEITVKEIHVKNKLRMSNGDSTVYIEIANNGNVLFSMADNKKDSSFVITLMNGCVFISSSASDSASLSLSSSKMDSNFLLTTQNKKGGVITLSGTDSMSVLNDKGLSFYDQSVADAKADWLKTQSLGIFNRSEKDINSSEEKRVLYQKLLKTPKKFIGLDKLEE